MISKKVFLKGKPVTLIGRAIKTGMPAPQFTLVDDSFNNITLANFPGKIKIITSFLSLDTPVCDLQVKEFNKEASGFSPDVVVIGVSKDLPFAQHRFCSSNNIQNAKVFSDYRNSSFGINYGLLIKENNLLARAVIILDKNDIVRYAQIVEELTTPPDYKETLAKLNEIINAPTLPKGDDNLGKCLACEAFATPLSAVQVEKLITEITGWELVDGKKIVKELKFKDFIEAKYCLDLLSIIAEEQGHHPNFSLIYNKLKISLTTHTAGGLTTNDFTMAKIIDEVIN
ncbi:MAG: thiol peroxidase [Gammaproteobacteria bacterium]